MTERTHVLVVTGSRNGDRKPVRDCLDAFVAGAGDVPDILVCGDATGVDSHALEWAIDNRIFFQVFGADWDKFRRNAGPIRNERMLTTWKNKDNPAHSLLLAFPGDRGTHNCMQTALLMGYSILRSADVHDTF